MANWLKMAARQSILTLAQMGWSFRRIAAELGLDRETVSRHVKAAEAGDPVAAHGPQPPGPNAAIVITGSGGGFAPATAGPAEVLAPPATAGPAANAAIVIAGSTPADSLPPGDSSPIAGGPIIGCLPGRHSQCEPLRAIILQLLERGLTARRIWQDLVADHDFAGDYQSVQRFVRKLREATPLPFRRMESEPGAEAQVDFGKGGPVVAADGKRSRPHLFRIVLSCSRKACSEVVPRQTTEHFLRALENAFCHFGGVPRTLVIDNLRAAVSRADWYDPELNPKIVEFCRHYGTAVVPTRPYTPRHKGKVERGVGYAQSNALRGRTFSSLAEQNRFLAEWEATVADTRIHGTTRKQVGSAFADEKPALLPLPPARFPSFQEAQRIVNRDGHVEVARSYYSAPPEFVGRTVWARWDGRVVRLFDENLRQIAIHAQREPGRFATNAGHIDPRKRGGIERGAAWWLRKADTIGPHAGRWARSLLEERGVHALRAVMGLVGLTQTHPVAEVEQACRVAESHGAHRLRDIRNLLKRAGTTGGVAEQQAFEFVAEHPLIRSLDEYSALVHVAFDATDCTSRAAAVCPPQPPALFTEIRS